MALHKHSGLTIGVGDSDAEIARRVKAFLLEQGAETLSVSSTIAAVEGRGQQPHSGKHLPKRVLTATIVEGSAADTPVAAEPSRGSSLQAALERGRARGAQRVAEILDQSDMLSGEAFGRLIGISRQAVDKRRLAGDLIGLQGPSRGVRYPAWQVSDDGQMVSGIGEVLKLAGGEPWTAYRLLLEAFPDGSGQRVVDKLRDGMLASVLEHVTSITTAAYS